MLKQRARLIAGTILTLDCVLITVAFFAAFWLRHDLANEERAASGRPTID